MSENPTLVDEIKQVRDFLLSPTRKSIQQCESKAMGLVQTISGEHVDIRTASEVKNLVREIRFLAESARDFWARRQLVTSPGQQYGSCGSMIAPAANPTFTVEV